jgi:hypothetical protein
VPIISSNRFVALLALGTSGMQRAFGKDFTVKEAPAAAIQLAHMEGRDSLRTQVRLLKRQRSKGHS